MSNARTVRLLLVTACVGALLPRAAQAQDRVTASATASTALGYSSNPFSGIIANDGSGFAEIDVQPQIKMVTEHNVYTLDGGVRYQRYFQHYSDSSSYRANLDYQGLPNQHIKTHLNLGFDSSILGANNVIGGGVVDPSLPQPPVNTGVDLSLFGTRDRLTSLNANGDVAVSLSARDNLKASAFFNRSRYGGLATLGDYDGFGGSAGFDRQVSQHVQAGAQASVARYDYQGPLSAFEVYSGQGTLSATLSARWKLDSALGLSMTTSNTGGGTRTSLSGNLKLCRVDDRGILCFTARRAVLPTGVSGTQNATDIGASYSYKVTERGTLSLSANYTKNANGRLVLANANEFLSGSLGYQQVLRERLSLVTSGYYRKIYGGPVSRPADIGGQLGIAVRFGDAR